MRMTTSVTSTGTKAKTRGAAPAPGLQNTKYNRKTQSTNSNKKHNICKNTEYKHEIQSKQSF